MAAVAAGSGGCSLAGACPQRQRGVAVVALASDGSVTAVVAVAATTVRWQRQLVGVGEGAKLAA